VMIRHRPAATRGALAVSPVVAAASNQGISRRLVCRFRADAREARPA
jgi:hypothetical protein